MITSIWKKEANRLGTVLAVAVAMAVNGELLAMSSDVWKSVDKENNGKTITSLRVCGFVLAV